MFIPVVLLAVSTIAGMVHAMTRGTISAIIAVSTLGLSWWLGNRQGD